MTDRKDVNVFGFEIGDDGVVSLPAAGVFEKYGFDDGGALDGVLLAGGYDPLVARREGADDEETLGMAVLTEVMARYLLPLIRPGALRTHMSLSHNPVRVDDTPANRAALDGHTIRVSRDEVLAIAAELTELFAPQRSPVAR